LLTNCQTDPEEYWATSLFDLDFHWV